MSKVEIKLNSAGVRELLRSKEVEECCKEYAQRAMEQLDDGYGMRSEIKGTRAVSTIYADSYKAKRQAYNENTLEKVVRNL